jgi:hypothetical protein
MDKYALFLGLTLSLSLLVNCAGDLQCTFGSHFKVGTATSSQSLNVCVETCTTSKPEMEPL